MDKRAFLDRIKNAEKSRLNNKLPDFDDSETVSYAAIGEGGARTVFERNFVKNRADIITSPKDIAGFLKSKGCKKGVIDPKLGTDFGLGGEFDISFEFDRDSADSYDFGITSADFAIAESGMIVLKDSTTSDRLASIAPWVHVAVLNASDIVMTLPEGFSKMVDCPYAIAISGPSKTTDVEGVLVEGVHGPGVQACLVLDK